MCRILEQSDADTDLGKKAELRKLHRRLESVSLDAKSHCFFTPLSNPKPMQCAGISMHPDCLLEQYF